MSTTTAPNSDIVQRALDETYGILRAAAIVAFSRMPGPGQPVPPTDQSPPSADWPISRETFDQVVKNKLKLPNGSEGPVIEYAYQLVLDPTALPPVPPSTDPNRPVANEGNWAKFAPRALSAAAAAGALAAVFAMSRGDNAINKDDLNDGLVIARVNCKPRAHRPGLGLLPQWYFCDY